MGDGDQGCQPEPDQRQRRARVVECVDAEIGGFEVGKSV